MTRSWLDTARAAALGGVLVLGGATTALADHRPSIDVQVSHGGVYTRFATGPAWGHYPPPYYAAPPPVVYEPGYWTYHPPRVYQPRVGYYYNDAPRHHHKHRDRGRHEGWNRGRGHRDDRHDRWDD